MKNLYFLFMLLLSSFTLFAQEGSLKATTISKAAYMHEIPALSKMDNIIAAKGLEHVAPPKRRGRNTFVPGKGLPEGKDPLAQNQINATKTPGKAPVIDFPAHSGTVLNDPTGAIGPNHYVYAFNSGFGILDRSGNVLVPEASLATLFPNETLGDPVVVYDRFANRFIIMEFSNSPNGFLIAVGQGPDPVNDGWFTYRFNTGSFPDYEKLSVWGDGYYITANKDQSSPSTNDVVFAVERDEMLTGNANAQMIGFPLPNASTSGFYSPGGFTALGASLPPVGTPQPIVYLQDDSWSGVSQDHLKIWNISVDWNTPTNSSISSPQILNTAPFDSVFDGGSFQNLDEPGSGPDIDALQATMMYMTNYRRFGTHNSAVMNFVVDVSGNDTVAGVRWLELRQSADGQPWTIYQEGTYTQPNGYSAFSGSIGMDAQGNIGLGYTIVSNTVYTSLRYTGRGANDPLGTMTVAEQTIVNGDSQTNRSDGRYGDYAQLTVDPVDDMTFWHIGEYMKGPSNVRKSHVAAFQIVTGPPDTEAPSTPTNLTASNTTATTTDLSWNDSTDNVGVTGYDVYQGGNVVGTTSNTSYTATGLSPLTSYNFYVVAKDAAGNQSGNSNTVNATTLDVSGCTGGITSFPYTESFENTIGAWTQNTNDDINWTVDANGTPSSNTGPSSAVDGSYYIYVEASSPNYPSKRAIISSPCYDLGAAPSATFSFQYHMYGAADMGSIDLEASNNDGISWTSIWNKTGNQGNTWLSVDIDLAAYVGGSVQFRFNRFIGSTWQADIAIDAVSLTVSGPADTEAPTAPTNLTASNTSFSTTDLSWTASTDNTGVTGYDVYQDGNVISTAASTSYNVTGLNGATSYNFYVVAKDAAGNESSNSNTVNVITLSDTQAPTAPANLTASNTTTSSTDLSWNASTDNVGVTGYDVYQNGSFIAATGGTSYNVTGLSESTSYNFYVVAKDAAGNESSNSNTVSVTTNAGGGSTVLHQGFFETGWDGWADGGSDASRYSGSRSYEGNYSIRIRDNSNSSTMTLGSFDVTSYSSIDIEFYFYANSMENGEDFWVQFYNGSSWNTVAAYARGTDFNNNTFYVANVTVDSGSYNFASNAQFRFRCDASGNNDQIYIDQITITGNSGARSKGDSINVLDDTTITSLDTYQLSDDNNDEFKIYPNPVQTILEVKTLGLRVDDVKIFSAYGILVRQSDNLGSTDSINVSDLATGTYFIRFVSGDKIVTRTFIKK